MKKPFLNGSVWEPLIRMCMEDGTEEESTVISWALKWREEEKLNRLGTVNSDARRKPKYPREQAAQNIIWSGRLRSSHCQMINIKSSVTGKRVEEGVPWQRLMPRTTLCWWRQSASGSRNP